MGLSYIDDPKGGQGRILVYFRGQVDADRLARAVRLTIEAEPILGYRFVNDQRHPYWQKVDESDWTSFFTMVECSPSDPDLYNFIFDQVQPVQAPQIKVGLFRSENDLMCIKVNHISIDGGGAIQYLSLLSSLYRELEKNPLHKPSSNNSGRRGPRQVLKHAGLISAIKALPNLHMPAPVLGISRISDDQSKQAFTFRQIDPERLGTIQLYARERGVTMNDILLTAFCRSFFVTCDIPLNRPFRIEVPVSLRRYLPAGSAETICNLSGAYFLSIERRDNEDFEGTLKRIHDVMEEEKKNRTELAEMLFLELVLLPGMFLIKSLMKYNKFEMSHPALSNLGIIDPRVVDFGGVQVEDVRELGPILFPPNIRMGAISFRQRLTLSLSYCSSAVDPKTMESFLELFLDELPGRSITQNMAE